MGRRRLIGSRSEVVDLVLRHRPDILFLGDLVTARHHIGRLKNNLSEILTMSGLRQRILVRPLAIL